MSAKLPQNAIEALANWYEEPESREHVFKPTPLAPERRELLNRLRGHLDVKLLAGNLAATARLLWAGVTNEDAGLDRGDVADTLAAIEELAELIAEVDYAHSQVDHRLRMAELFEAQNEGGQCHDR